MRKRTKRDKEIDSFRLTDEAEAEINSGYPDEVPVEEEPSPAPKKHRLRRFLVKLAGFCILLVIADIAVLFFTGELWFNRPDRHRYPLHGVFITEKQGSVDWKNFARQDIQFCYIRATKSTAYEDENFKANKAGSAKTELPVGMLHLFDASMGGKEQAEHFIEVCGDMQGRLRPAVDIRRSFVYKILPADYDKQSAALVGFCDRIKEEYGCMPVIKCDKATYENVASRSEFEDCPVWIVSEFGSPDESIEWDIWSYDPNGRFNHHDNSSRIEMMLLDKGISVDELYI